MEIRSIPIAQINPAPYNPRQDLQPGDPAYEQLRRSIEEFGYVDPCIWNERTGNLVGGHQRFKILVARGDKEIMCSIVDLDDQRERALNLALNRIAGDWDNERLAALLAELDADGFDLTFTGFDSSEIDALLAEIEEPDEDAASEDEFDVEAAAEAIAHPVTQRGDVWLLGRHRLMCGDSTVLADVERLMADGKADMVFTDPPYNVAYEGKTSERLTIQNDNMDLDAFYEFLLDAFRCMLTTSAPGAPIYVCHADVGGVIFRRAFMDAGWSLRQTLIWVKNSIVLGRQDYHWQHEPILYGWRPGAAHRWYGQRDKSTVLDDEPNVAKLSRAELQALVRELRNERSTTAIREDKPAANDIHPTMKPVRLVARCMVNSSRRGDVVQDLFGGGGSTLMAAEQLGRTARLMELDPRYCDAIVMRWQRFTGERARRESDGALFDSM